MTAAIRSQLVKTLASELGFDRCGIASAQSIGRREYLRRWLSQGHAGSMDYLHQYFSERVDPRELLRGARSLIVVAHSYHHVRTKKPGEAGEARGRVAMYAWGDDYHIVIRGKLQQLVVRMRERFGDAFEARICVDTAPLVEREVAATAGVGWIGKNTLVLHPELGSYFFLGVIVTTLELAADLPMEDHCGTCTACLEACPTQAFIAPYQMDASRCISYLTIEHRGDISKPFQEMMGDWVFGCDVCQEVCPHNQMAPETGEPRFAVRDPGPRPRLEEVLAWSPDEYRAKLRGSAMKRAKLSMLQRNARIAAANLSAGNAKTWPSGSTTLGKNVQSA